MTTYIKVLLGYIGTQLVLSENKKQVVFYHKNAFFIIKKINKIKTKTIQNLVFFFCFCLVFIFFHLQNAVMCCFLHSLWLITLKQLLTLPLTHYVTAGR